MIETVINRNSTKLYSQTVALYEFHVSLVINLMNLIDRGCSIEERKFERNG